MPIPFFAQSWSVGVEEQFFLVWPLTLLRRFKNTAILLGSIIIIYLFVKLGLFGIIKYKLHYWYESQLFTILVYALSYQYMEKYFLLLKGRFTKVKSSDSLAA